MNINATLAKINKKFGDNVIGFAKDLTYTDVSRLSSGSLFLDWSLGKNIKEEQSGWPLGRIIELYGPESSGKSLIALKTIVQAQKKGFDCLYIDCENTFDKEFAKRLGVDTSKLLLSRESGGEKLIDLACMFLEEYKDLRVVVFDSLASMIPMVEITDSMEQMQMAPMARLMSKGLRKLTSFNKNNALILFINQLRVNPGTKYGNPEYTPGGRSLKFYASIRVDVRRGDWIFDAVEKKKKIGQVVKFRIVKNKSDIPYKEGYFKFMYNGTIDKVDQLISLGLLNKKIIRKGAYFNLLENRWQGREAMEIALKEDSKLFEQVRKEVFRK